ncbi:TetR family transcriptional regulator [Nitrospirillum sp. BR 11828]|uniref:TetR family transcriptional regulator n=1 Tax=Nitrospirillum sp. BR 11828 TaxID=3104325 RepID=UPI002ACAF0AF|nr:TetR family transcriptional regulator [Nitrospirillum sp. BR 11828]MDZ5645805.1 TetR family transcriptional regulator [Nitrospirillum sp. BR 11828]
MTDDQQNNCTDLLPASLRLVAQEGLGALSLRRLAAAAETSLSALSYRFGKKERLIAQVIAAAHEQDRDFWCEWARRVDAMSGLSGLAIADIAEAVLVALTAQHPERSLFFCELVQASAWDETVRAALGPWLATRLAFWRRLCAKAAPGTAPQVDLAVLLHAYSIDETAFSLSLRDHAPYAWLRKLGLRRLCTPHAPPGNRAADERLFQVFYDESATVPDTVALDREDIVRTPLETQAMAHAAALIVREGAEAVTHRAVAKAANVPASTLAYRFRRQEDLLKAGLEGIIRQMWQEVEAPPAGAPEGGNAPIARGTYAIALAATRRPELVACAAAMRRRRGENINRYLTVRTGTPHHYDPLTTQALAVTRLGQRMLEGRHPDQITATAAVVQALETWLGAKI